MTAAASSFFFLCSQQCIITMFSLAFQVHLPLSRTACALHIEALSKYGALVLVHQHIRTAIHSHTLVTTGKPT